MNAKKNFIIFYKLIDGSKTLFLLIRSKIVSDTVIFFQDKSLNFCFLFAFICGLKKFLMFHSVESQGI